MRFNTGKQTKAFLALMFATTIPTLLMFVAFTRYYNPTATGLATALIAATAFIMIYGFVVSLLGVKKFLKR